MVRLAKGHAGEAVGHAAEVDGVEAAEERAVPWLGALGGLGVDDLAGASEDVVEARLPLVHVVVAERTGLGGLLCGHAVCVGEWVN